MDGEAEIDGLAACRGGFIELEARPRGLLALLVFGVVVAFVDALGRGGSKEGRLRLGAGIVLVDGIMCHVCGRSEKETVW